MSDATDLPILVTVSPQNILSAEISSNIINAQIQNVQSPTVATVGIQGPPGPPWVVALTTNDNNGAATFSGGNLNVPNYTLSGLGGQPALGYTPANKAGDTFTGNIAAPNLSGINTGNETATSIGAIVNAATKSALLPADLLAIVDSAANNILSSVSYANLQGQIVSYGLAWQKSQSLNPPSGATTATVLQAELAACSAAKTTLLLSPGTYNLPDWPSSGLSLSFVSLLGTSENAVNIIGPGNNNSGCVFITPTDQSIVEMSGVAVSRFNHLFQNYFGVLSYTIKRCKFSSLREFVIYAMDISNGWSSSVGRIDYVDNQHLNTCGINIRSQVGAAQVIGNYFKNVGRDETVYTTISDHDTYAICIGDSNQYQTAQTETLNVQVIGNIVDGLISSTSNDAYSSNAIEVIATRANVDKNIVFNVVSANTVENASGIYTEILYGTIQGNILVNACTQPCPLAIKGKSSDLENAGGALARYLDVSGNIIISTKSSDITAAAIDVFGSSAYIDIHDNQIAGFGVNGVLVQGCPNKVHTRNNKFYSVGGGSYNGQQGSPVQYSCGDITECDVTGNEVFEQIMPNNTSVTAVGVMLKAVRGQFKGIQLVSGGSGYVVNLGLDANGNYWNTFASGGSTTQPASSSNGYAFVNLIGTAYSGTTLTQGLAFVYIIGGVITSVSLAANGANYQTFTGVSLPTPSGSYTGGVTGGSGASFTASISTGVMTDVHVSGRFTGTVNTTDAAAYECIELNVDTSSSVYVDSIDSKIEGTNTAIYGVHYNSINSTSSVYTNGCCGLINMYGNNGNARQIPWRIGGSANLARGYLIAAGYMFRGPALVNNVLKPPAPLLYSWPDGNHVTLNICFSRFFNTGNSYLGVLPINNQSGGLIIKSVTCRVIFASGATSLTSSGSPTVGLGTASGTNDLIAATGIAAINSAAGSYLTTLVTGPSTEIVKTAAPSLYLNIAGANINSNSNVYLMIDIEYRVSY